MNKLYNDTAVQAIANAIRAKNGSSDTYTIAEMSTALNDISYYAKPTISNVALATFEADGLPLNSLKVSVKAKQAGSGTPSPENVRPIRGWDAVVVTDTDDVDNPTVTQTTTISLGQTVYGGEVDVVNGTSGNKITYGYVDLGDLTWTNRNSDSPGVFSSADITDYEFSESVAFACSNYNPNGTVISVSAMNSRQDGSITFYFQGTSSGRRQIYIKDVAKSSMTGEEFKAAMSGVQLVYELATPTTFTTQPRPIKSLNGTNNLSVDCGDVIELEYFKEV